MSLDRHAHLQNFAEIKNDAATPHKNESVILSGLQHAVGSIPKRDGTGSFDVVKSLHPVLGGVHTRMFNQNGNSAGFQSIYKLSPAELAAAAASSAAHVATAGLDKSKPPTATGALTEAYVSVVNNRAYVPTELKGMDVRGLLTKHGHFEAVAGLEKIFSELSTAGPGAVQIQEIPLPVATVDTTREPTGAPKRVEPPFTIRVDDEPYEVDLSVETLRGEGVAETAYGDKKMYYYLPGKDGYFNVDGEEAPAHIVKSDDESEDDDNMTQVTGPAVPAHAMAEVRDQNPKDMGPRDPYDGPLRLPTRGMPTPLRGEVATGVLMTTKPSIL